MLLIICRRAGVFVRNTLRPSVLGLTECHSWQSPFLSLYPPDLVAFTFAPFTFVTFHLPRGFRASAAAPPLQAKRSAEEPGAPTAHLGREDPTMRKPKTRGYFEPWEAVRSHDWERGFSSEKGKRTSLMCAVKRCWSSVGAIPTRQ